MKIYTKNPLAIALPMAICLLAASPAVGTVIVSEAFGGSGANLNGTSADTFDAGITSAGGSASWLADVGTYFDDGSVVVDTTNSTSASLNLGSYINDHKGQSDGLFELTVTLAQVGGSWFSVGFSTLNTPDTDNQFLGEQGMGTVIRRAGATGDIDMWGGPGGDRGRIDLPGGVSSPSGAVTLTVTLDLRPTAYNGTTTFGTVTWSESSLGVIGSVDYDENLSFGSIFLSEANATTTTLSNLTLTQTPEPGSLALMALGGLCVLRRRRS